MQIVRVHALGSGLAAANLGRGGLANISTLPTQGSTSGTGSTGSTGGTGSTVTPGTSPFGAFGGLGGTKPPTNNLFAAAANTVIGLTTGLIGTAQISALISAAETRGEVKTVATPRVTALNNRPAQIESGSQIPVQTTQAAGGTAVVTLEPCNHYGRTGPCSQALIAAGLSRVVYAVNEPMASSAGGAEELVQAGVAVEGGVLAAEAGGEDACLAAVHARAEALRDAALGASVPTDFVLYPEAQHGFHCDARPQAYDENAAKDAWGRTLAWLAEHVAQPR